MSIPTAESMAKELVPMLLPLLPYLMKGVKMASKKFVEAVGEKGGEKVVQISGDIWDKLKPKIAQDPEAKKVIDEVVENPNKEYIVGTMLYLFKQILEDENLRKEIALLLEESNKEGLTIKNYIDAGEVYGEMTGVKVTNLEALQVAGLIESEINVKTVKKGGKVTGVEIN